MTNYPDSPATNQPMQIETGTVEEYKRTQDIHVIRLDRGLVIEANALDIGVKRNIPVDQKVVVIRTKTMQWSILGVVPVPNLPVSGDREIDALYARQPEAAPSEQASYRLRGREVLGPDDKEVEARSDSSHSRIVLFSVGGVLIEAGRTCYRYMNGLRRRVIEFCHHFIIKTPGATVSLQADGTTQSTQASIKIRPNLSRGTTLVNNIDILAGADAVSANGMFPNASALGQEGQLTNTVPGIPGISMSMGELLRALASSTTGTIRITTGDAATFELSPVQLMAEIAEARLTMNPAGIIIESGAQSISLGVDELRFTLSALTMTISGAANVTAGSIALNGITSIQGYNFIEDLVTRLNAEWAVVFAAHTHASVGAPSGTLFPPITPTGTGT